MDPPPVSIGVAAYNAESTIRPLLDSLLELEYPDYEVVIVDDGSVDRTADIVREYTGSDSSIRLVEQANQGASAARNRAFEAASNEIIAYTDSDTRVDGVWLRELVRPFSDPDVGATTGRTVFGTNNTCTSWVRSVDIAVRNSRRGETTRLANGPNCAFRRELLAEIGGFDPEWFHAEDTAVSYDVYAHGYEIRYVPEAEVYHVPEDDWREYLSKRYRDAKAFTRVLFTHPKDAAVEDDFVPATWKLQPPLFAVLVFGLPLMLLLGPLGLVTAAGVFAIGVALNVPFALRVAWRARRPRFFWATLALTTARGFFWGLGLVVGAVTNGFRYGPRSVID
jgi:cellulose synthase/poly-beta-1,6-N-acetylglucosamine synthase-like glycosyltransferase